MYNIITKKKQGKELTKEEIRYVVEGFTNGQIPDYQVSALLMAICINGMDEKETFELTMAMAESGDMLSLDEIGNITADKHSTGGVGDKTSLIIGPLAASMGVSIAKMSGRGLGHTGGTIDKLESIKGFKTELSDSEFKSVVKDVGMAIVGQSANLAPADKVLYALRDVTATVDNISLIASSIMSKKLAAGSDIIVLDVKTGSGAFMKTLEDAKKLAETMVDIGRRAGRKMYALISDMNQPLGSYVGNKLEVYEAVKTLNCEGPGDLTDSCAYLTGLIFCGANKASNITEGYELAMNALRNGQAIDVFKRFVLAQGGDASFVENIEDFCKIKNKIPVFLGKKGYVQEIDTEAIGMSSLYLGGGRTRKGEDINSEVGIQILKKHGDYVKCDEAVAYIFADEGSNINRAKEAISSAYVLSETQPDLLKHFYGYYDEQGYHELNKN